MGCRKVRFCSPFLRVCQVGRLHSSWMLMTSASSFRGSHLACVCVYMHTHCLPESSYLLEYKLGEDRVLV